MKSQQTDLEAAKARFVSALGSKAEDLRVRLEEYLVLPRPESRDDLRRRWHALATSARLFSMHELEETSRSAVSMLDVLRDEAREPTREEADFFGTMMGRIQSLATSHQSGSYSSSAFRLAQRSPKASDEEQVREDAARKALTQEIEGLLRDAVIDRSCLYDDGLRQRCEQMGAPHLGVLQRLRDGTPAHDLLADRAVNRVVLRETLEALRVVGALRVSSADETAEVVQDLEFDLAAADPTHRFTFSQWLVMLGVLTGLAVVILGASQSYVAGPATTEPEPDVPSFKMEPVVALEPQLVVPPDQDEPTAEIPAPVETEQTVLEEPVEQTPEALPPGHGELVIMPGSQEGVRVKVRGKDHGPPPVRLVLRKGLHTVVFESESGTHYRFWHVHANQRRQVSAP